MSNRPKIFVLDVYHRAGLDLAAEEADLVLWDDPAAANWREEADALMVRMTPLRAEDFAAAKRLKVVVKQGVGIETIDLDAARAHGIAVCNTPGVNSEAVAELALALGLTVTRRVAEMDRAVRGGGKAQRDLYLGLEASGRAVGIVGMGNIGTRVARKWRGAFDLRLIGYDPYVPAGHWPDLPHERAPSLQALLPQVDILTIHCPLNAETRHLIGRAELALMKPTAVVVNAARGGIVDETALYEALRDGKLFGAGLDVFEVEPPTLDSTPLLSLPNLVATPHAAGGTQETQARSSELVARQVLDVLAGRPALSRVA
ncbi:MAG TPA: hydroxyacid dehydrogenase [Roseomonas sp.]|jgi:D-3-phosphoglycerate dehydrogenase